MWLRGSCAACAAAVLVATLAACDSREEAAAAAEASKQTAREQSSSRDRDMVAAVSPGGSGPPIELRFALTQRPMVGEPVDVRIELLPVAPLERLFVRFHGGEDLKVASGGESPQIASPVTGVPISHTVSVVPLRDGIFNLTATVVADSSTLSLTRTYSIPLIAGEGVQAAPEAAEPSSPPSAAR